MPSAVTESREHPAPPRATETPAVSQSHWSVLAATRFVLAAIVLTGHISMFVPPRLQGSVALCDSFAAMVAFLTVSGFSISGSLQNEVRQFYARRVIRVAPVYLVTLAISLVPWLFFPTGMVLPSSMVLRCPGWRDVIACLFLLQAFLPVAISSFAISWTLSIECLYYALAPVLRRAPTLLLLAYCGASWYGYVGHFRMGYSPWNAFYLGGAWVIGMVGHRHRGAWWSFPLMAAFGGSMLFVHSPSHNPYAAYTYMIGPLAIVFGRWLKPDEASRRLFNFLGDVSYPLYLVHWSVLMLLIKALPPGWVECIPVLWATPVALATALTVLIDRPARAALRRRLRAHSPRKAAA